jgi:hypothetical protein
MALGLAPLFHHQTPTKINICRVELHLLHS